ncbi:hypothetical protein D3C75_967370 [compost metagenome]
MLYTIVKGAVLVIRLLGAIAALKAVRLRMEYGCKLTVNLCVRAVCLRLLLFMIWTINVAKAIINTIVS